LVKKRAFEDYNRSYFQVSGTSDLHTFFEVVNADELALTRQVPLDLKLSVHDLTSLKPPTAQKFDLIVCRNTLIYFKPSLQNQVIAFLVSNLNSGGIIVLGSRESLAFYSESDNLQPLDEDSKIYRKK
jgi:chemotaxis methyl-accepting protein methylase